MDGLTWWISIEFPHVFFWSIIVELKQPPLKSIDVPRRKTWPDMFHWILVVANRDPYFMVYEIIPILGRILSPIYPIAHSVFEGWQISRLSYILQLSLKKNSGYLRVHRNYQPRYPKKTSTNFNGWLSIEWWTKWVFPKMVVPKNHGFSY